MWTKQQTQSEAPAAPPVQGSASPVASFGGPSIARPGIIAARNLASLGSSLVIKGQITGTEDLQIDGKVDGPISLRGHQLTVGSTAQLNSEIHAGEVVVYGKSSGISMRATASTSRRTARSLGTSLRRASALRTAPISRAASRLTRPNPKPRPISAVHGAPRSS
jgi:hypothetical protein